LKVKMCRPPPQRVASVFQRPQQRVGVRELARLLRIAADHEDRPHLRLAQSPHYIGEVLLVDELAG
jgi:hypothetical protein